MRSFVTFIVTTFFFITSFNFTHEDFNKSGSEIENFKWLLGTWEMKTSKGSIYETWTFKNNSEFSGKSYSLKGADTIVFETVRLIEKGGDVLYIPAVKDQNNGNPVVFKTSYASRSKFIVENPEHDFPKVISYTRIAEDQLVAEISGPATDGAYKYQTFTMKRYPDSNFKNIELVERVFQYFNEHNWKKMACFYADPSEFKDPSLGIEIVIQTRDEIVKKYLALNKMAPDIKDNIVAIYPSGEKHVIVEFISSGTSTDGSKWSLPLVTIFTIENGTIVKDFTYYDNQ